MKRKKLTLLILLLMGIVTSATSQGISHDTYGIERVAIDTKPANRFLSVGAGIGPEYGNIGLKVQAKLTKSFGLSAGIGTRSTPMSFGIVMISGSGLEDKEKEDALKDNDIPYSNSTIDGLSFSAGMDIWLSQSVYMGLYFSKFGEYQPLLQDNKQSIYGGFWSITGRIPLGEKIPLALNVGGFMGLGFSGKDEFVKQYYNSDNISGNTFILLLGANLGLSYYFNY